ncbi:MAG TPA: cytochrome c biogenesis protein CcdA [Leptolinea sp.]
MNISLGLAFLAGLASFLSPCVFSLVPAYIGYLGGRSLSTENTFFIRNRWSTFTHGLAFVVGFSLVFIGLGLTSSFIGSLLFEMRAWLARIGGIVVFLFGLQMTGLLRMPWLDYDLRPKTRLAENRSYISSLFMGIVFSAGWSPCVGPILGTILTLALNEGSINNGAILLSVYSAGLAIPFLIMALGIDWIASWMKKFGRYVGLVEKGMGVILLVVGVLLFFGIFEQIARFGFYFNFGL